MTVRHEDGGLSCSHCGAKQPYPSIVLSAREQRRRQRIFIRRHSACRDPERPLRPRVNAPGVREIFLHLIRAGQADRVAQFAEVERARLEEELRMLTALECAARAGDVEAAERHFEAWWQQSVAR